MRRDAYSGRVKLNGEEHQQTLRAADNSRYLSLELRRFKKKRRAQCYARGAARDASSVMMRALYTLASTRGPLQPRSRCSDEDSAEDEKRGRHHSGAHPTTQGQRHFCEDAVSWARKAPTYRHAQTRTAHLHRAKVPRVETPSFARKKENCTPLNPLSSGLLLLLDARQPRRRLVRLAALPLRRHRTTQTRLEQRRALA